MPSALAAASMVQKASRRSARRPGNFSTFQKSAQEFGRCSPGHFFLL
jgi:hypothetical protein